MYKLWLSAGVALLLAQNDLDAERWSQMTPQGTARALGMAGAFTALGGDPANLTQNPAGLGVFMRGGIWLSPAISLPTTSTTYIGTTSQSRTHFGLKQFALLLHSRGGKAITHWNFGFGYNQEGFFPQNSQAVGFNVRNSFTQSLAESAEGIPDTLLSGSPALAYQNYFDLGAPLGIRGIIDPISTNPYRYRGVFSQGGVYQEITSQEAGRLNTWSVGFGFCYQNTVFFGASLLIRNLSYSKTYRLREIDTENRYNGQNNTTPADEVTFREKYSSSGTGVGLALGVLVEPTDFMRFGFSFTTGSRIRITDEYNADMEMVLDDGRRNTTTYAEPFQYVYRFSYPYRVSGGIAFLLGGKGAVSIEADFLDYRTAAFSSADYSYDRENEFIESQFNTAINARAGVEWLVLPGLSLRGGYAYYSPVRNTQGRLYYPDPSRPSELSSLPMQRQFVSIGMGYAMEKFFVDIAYLYATAAQKYLPYSLRDPAYAPAPVIVIQNRTHAVVTTLGLRF
ncbi:MAG: outer membrane protein transport protein [Bacteroidia bacterium]|nr:outer membrane protein transport protein [Bacteroidia bacterium]